MRRLRSRVMFASMQAVLIEATMQANNRIQSSISCPCVLPCMSKANRCFPKVTMSGSPHCRKDQLQRGVWTARKINALRKRFDPTKPGACFCPAQTDDQTIHVCPIDCKTTAWQNWTPCTKSCGVGQRSRTRLIVSGAVNGGSKCPALHENSNCNAFGCAVDCEVSKWKSAWTSCSQTCGTGIQKNTRTVVKPALGGGKLCPPLMKTRDCKIAQCPSQPCQVGSWSAFAKCSTTCGVGKKVRKRHIVQQPHSGGTPCPVLQQERLCEQHECPIDCSVKGWSVWGPCSKSCGSGQQERVRDIVSHPLYGGKACPQFLKEFQVCNPVSCAEDCETTPWSEWSTCSRSCESVGTQKGRERPRFGGKACPSLKQSRPCDARGVRCPADCAVSAWTRWTKCVRSCGMGIQARTRTLVHVAAAGGKGCPPLIDQRKCNTNPCPVDCVWSQWGAFGSCDQSCGWGLKSRNRIAIAQAKHGGRPCAAAAMVDKRSCRLQPCCPGNQVWTKCFHACTRTCDCQAPSTCHNTGSGPKCIARCACPSHSPLWNDGKCITPSGCPASVCKQIHCSIGARGDVHIFHDPSYAGDMIYNCDKVQGAGNTLRRLGEAEGALLTGHLRQVALSGKGAGAEASCVCMCQSKPEICRFLF